MEELQSFIRGILPFSDRELAMLEDMCTCISAGRGQVLLKEGQTANSMYFIEKGLLFGSVSRDGRDTVNWFADEGDFVTSMYSFISRRPAHERIEVLEDAILQVIAYDDLQTLYCLSPTFERLGRLLTERDYILLEERALILQSSSAAERYRLFLEKEPDLYHRISLGHLSSYLGVSRETLSRIRSKR
jgi:CRP-like cAMP-binding protein